MREREGDAEALRNNAENDRTTRSVRRLHVNAVKCLLRRVALSVYTFSPQDLPEGPLAVKLFRKRESCSMIFQLVVQCVHT